MILGIDIGGTKVTVGEFRRTAASQPASGTLERTYRYASAEYRGLVDLLRRHHEPQGDTGTAERIEAIGIGVAGPVLDGRAKLTNLSWVVDAAQTATEMGCPVVLLNDLEAHGTAVAAHDVDGYCCLNTGKPRPGNRVLIAAGTGLGEALLFWDGQRYRTSASEGGHASFAPACAEDTELLRFLQGRYEHVSWERVVSGLDGFRNLFDFLAATKRIQVPAADLARMEGHRDIGPVLCSAAAEGVPYAQTVMRWFARLYGAEAGNLALKALAVGGVFVAGGIAPRILPFLESGDFLAAMTAKGRFRGLLEDIPVYVVTDEYSALKGAALAAAELL